jgi:hypothetical protein
MHVRHARVYVFFFGQTRVYGYYRLTYFNV